MVKWTPNCKSVNNITNFFWICFIIRCTWMKIQDSGMIIEEQPTKVVEAMKLFLQGLGYNLKKSSMMF